jgi:hypothetical protein
MTQEKKIILDKIDVLLSKKKLELLKELPDIHIVDDGIIIRFFTEWDNCEDNNEIKYKKIINYDNSNESVVFFYIPKDSYFDLKQRFHIGCITCLNGKINIITNKITRFLEGYSKICVHTNDVQGNALENTYLIITSNKLDWSKTTQKYVMENY